MKQNKVYRDKKNKRNGNAYNLCVKGDVKYIGIGQLLYEFIVL